MKKNIYLDNGATTQVADEVVKAMTPFFSEAFGNASSIHSYGQESRKVLSEARTKIAKALNAEPCEIIFTSGGTEANNTALKTVAKLERKNGKNHIITSKIEHPSIYKTCADLEKQGFRISYVDVDNEGVVDVEQIKKEICSETALVSIMHANNEIGTIQPIEEIGAYCREKGVLFHTDSVQSFTKTSFDVKKQNIDLASFSAHKIHGPKGIGALYVRKGINLESYFHGGSQEMGKRAGTENIPAIVGFEKAVEIVDSKDLEKMRELRDYTINRVLAEIKHSRLNGSKEKRLGNNVNISFDYVEGESLLMQLNDKGVAVSTGSACSSKSLKPSHVLLAIGLQPVQAHGSIRMTLSKYTTKEDLDYAVDCLKESVENLRKLSPLNENVC